jgi:chromate transporter
MISEGCNDRFDPESRRPLAVSFVCSQYFRRAAGNLHIKAFVDGVTAAATGAIAGAAFVLGKRAIIDFPTALIALATLGILSTVRKVPELLVILAAGAVGLLLQWAAHT